MIFNCLTFKHKTNWIILHTIYFRIKIGLSFYLNCTKGKLLKELFSSYFQKPIDKKCTLIIDVGQKIISAISRTLLEFGWAISFCIWMHAEYLFIFIFIWYYFVFVLVKAIYIYVCMSMCVIIIIKIRYFSLLFPNSYNI